MSRLVVPSIAVAPSLFALLLCGSCPSLSAQEPIGTIEASSATVSGPLSLTGDKALIGANAVITARDRTATVNLSRGGEVLVCRTSALHAARGAGPAKREPLLLALDRGAVEIHMAATAADAVLTPDLRFTIATSTGRPAAGLLDLRIRVAGNGDTCVENRGKAAPTLEVSEQFGSGLYQVHPNQHLLFEHGSLREVVDDETSPCGCPPPPVLSASNSGISTDVTRAARPGARVADDPDEVRAHNPAEVQHPFPAAESQGLTLSGAPAYVPQSPPREPHAQVAATLSFGPGSRGFDGTNPTVANTPAAPASTPAPAAPAPAPAPAPATKQPSSTPPASAPTAVAPAPVPASAPTPAAPIQPAPQPPPATPPQPTPAPPPVSVTTAPPVNDKLSDHEIAQSPLPPPAPSAHTISHRIGHFFHHLFVGK